MTNNVRILKTNDNDTLQDRIVNTINSFLDKEEKKGNLITNGFVIGSLEMVKLDFFEQIGRKSDS